MSAANDFPMTQLLLDLGAAPPATFDNFIVDGNGEAVAALRRVCAAPVDDAPARCVYLWGEAGSGRSHLLRAAAAALDGAYVDGTGASVDAIRAASDPDPARERWLLAVDDVETTTPAVQEALFHALNAMRQDPRGAIVVAGEAAPRDLALAPGRDDLRSRLAWGYAAQLHPLDDAAKDAALARRADEIGFRLSDDVRRYLMTHVARDLGSLMRLVEALDVHAREHRRAITVPLIRDFLTRPAQDAADGATLEALGHAA